MRLKLLPIVIIAAGLAVATRLGGVWMDIDVQAQVDQGEPVSETSAMASETAVDSTPPDDTSSQVDGETVAEDSDPVDQDVTADFQKAALSSNPFDLTDEDIEILQALSQRREELEQRERQLNQRDALLQAAEARLEQKVQALGSLKKEIEGLLAEQRERDDTQVTSLVRIYESMKPKDAARIMQDLDLEIALDVLRRMKERKSAPILAKMSAERAQTITIEMAARNDLPIPQD